MATEVDGTTPVPRLKERYRNEIAPALREEFGYGNVMQIPGLTKIVVNMGVGEAARDAKLIDGAVRDLAAISGSPPVIRMRRTPLRMKASDTRSSSSSVSRSRLGRKLMCSAMQ